MVNLFSYLILAGNCTVSKSGNALKMAFNKPSYKNGNLLLQCLRNFPGHGDYLSAGENQAGLIFTHGC